MAKDSKISGKTSSAAASTASPTSKEESYVVNFPLTQSEIAWLREQSKRVAVAFSQRSDLTIKR